MERPFRFSRFFGKGPLISAGLFSGILLLLAFWGPFVRFTDRYPLLRLMMFAEWAIKRYQQGEALWGFTNEQFFWFLILQQVAIWTFWITVFWKVSPWISVHHKTKSALKFLTLQNHENNIFARGLTAIIRWGMRHKRVGTTISFVSFFGFSFVSHGDIATIAVAIGFRRWRSLGIVLAAMICKIIAWSVVYLGFP